MIVLEILEQFHIKLLESSISELEKWPAYIIALWWQGFAINIPLTKEQTIYL